MIRRWLEARRVRKAAQRAAVLDCFTAHPDRHWHVTGSGETLAAATGLHAGRLGPILRTFEATGLVLSGWDPDPTGTGRRQYWLAPRAPLWPTGLPPGAGHTRTSRFRSWPHLPDEETQ